MGRAQQLPHRSREMEPWTGKMGHKDANKDVLRPRRERTVFRPSFRDIPPLRIGAAFSSTTAVRRGRGELGESRRRPFQQKSPLPGPIRCRPLASLQARCTCLERRSGYRTYSVRSGKAFISYCLVAWVCLYSHRYWDMMATYKMHSLWPAAPEAEQATTKASFK
ncbi:PREDICTED: uncharacterized protein LOC108448775 isoform X3 [Corvus brachyrhynchos]|uniref:uncharacterized protein LOC108448775 isoform X3 n=1 Tax=Corvus brachyrhynchos TaxID=85066 RepID=UPI0008163A58|nr:PREDICTED: uncharacterized protein LOC108448775 isoform X3 [Corvus brachyrhynchos]